MAKTTIALFGDDGVEHVEFDSNGSSDEYAEEFSNIDPSWKSSEAFFRSDGGSAAPTLTIKQSTIWVYWQATGSGYITSTTLIGPEGEYAFTVPNASYEVVPGKYTHRVRGSALVPPGGSIASGIRYK